MRLAAPLCLAALVLPLPVLSTTIHVPADQPTIQAGINAAAFAGDTVLVAPGTYTGIGNKDLNLKGKQLILKSESGPETTIIDCEDQGRGFYFQAGEGHGAIVDGFTIENGRVSGSFPDNWGGGILCVTASPTIVNCVIESNEALNAGMGAGIACYDASPIISGCTILSNQTSGGGSGGGLGCLESTPQIEHTLIRSNNNGGVFLRQTSAVFDSCSIEFNSFGGIAAVEGSSVTMSNCTLTSNSTNGDGGGAYFEASTGVIANCVLASNSAQRGGGIWIVGEASPSFSACQFNQNNASSRGGGIYTTTASPEIANCTFHANTSAVGGAIFVCCSLATSPLIISDCLLTENSGWNWGAAVACDNGGSPIISRCIFIGNQGGFGNVLHSQFSHPRLENCTIYGSLGNSIFASTDTVTVAKSIIAFSPLGEAVSCGSGAVNLSCTDIYGNLGGNWTGCIQSQLGQNGNFALNPLFCDATNRIFTLRGVSPCAPGNSPVGCELIGALPVGCGVTDVADSPSVGKPRLTVMPNPVRGTARFEAGQIAPYDLLSIFDSQGRVVEQLSGTGGRWEWTPRFLPAGIYFAMPEGGVVGGEPVKFLYLR